MQSNTREIIDGWNSWMQSHLVETGYFSDIAISTLVQTKQNEVNAHGAISSPPFFTSLVQTPNFLINNDQINIISTFFYDPTPAYKNGITIGKTSFIPIMITDNFIYARKDMPGTGHNTKLCLFCTKSTSFIIIAISTMANKAAKIYSYLTRINNFLIENGL